MSAHDRLRSLLQRVSSGATSGARGSWEAGELVALHVPVGLVRAVLAEHLDGESYADARTRIGNTPDDEGEGGDDA